MTRKILMLAVLMAAALGISAKRVSQQTAASKAEQLMKTRISGFIGTVASTTAMTYQGQLAYYIVQFAPQGWALVAADDTSAPLIGYSPDGIYQTSGQPDNVRGQMNWYGEQIVSNARRVSTPHTGWQSADGLSTKEYARRAPMKAESKVAPLITVNWNQSGAFKYYCPGGSVVGCVAVGMAQAMSVPQYPASPAGSHGYDHSTYGWLYIDYDAEEAYDWATIMSTPNSTKVARLLYQCGVAVNMDYSPSGSGALSSAIAPALKTYFKYPQSVKYYRRDSYEAAGGDWKALILTELQEGRAVIYCGSDPKAGYGHCFNLDGYDGSFFHVNWGWGGSNNAYFGLDALEDKTMGYTYTSGQDVVVGIRPPSEYPMDIILSTQTVAANAPVGTEVATITVESEAESPTYTFTLKGQVNPITHKPSSVPFEVKDMKLVTTKAMPDAGKSSTFDMTVKNNENGHELTRTFTIKSVNLAGIAGIQAVAAKERYYTLDGRQLKTPRKGLNIVRKGQQTKKVIVK